MILRNNKIKFLLYNSKINYLLLTSYFLLLTSCRIYTFKDISIPPEIKTIKINFIENKARYVNPQVSPQLTDALQQKIIGQIRLNQTQNDDANYVINGQITGYDVTTVGVANQATATNRLTMAVHISLTNNVTNKTDEFDISQSQDFDAKKSLPEAEGQLLPNLIKDTRDAIFNRLFSNW